MGGYGVTPEAAGLESQVSRIAAAFQPGDELRSAQLVGPSDAPVEGSEYVANPVYHAEHSQALDDYLLKNYIAASRGAQPFIPITDQDVQVFKKDNELTNLRDFEEFMISIFDPRNPIQSVWLDRIAPWIPKRIVSGIERDAMARVKVAQMRAVAPQDLSSYVLLWLIQRDVINADGSLKGPAHNEPDSRFTMGYGRLRTKPHLDGRGMDRGVFAHTPFAGPYVARNWGRGAGGRAGLEGETGSVYTDYQPDQAVARARIGVPGVSIPQGRPLGANATGLGFARAQNIDVPR